jgi:restriction system protein
MLIITAQFLRDIVSKIIEPSIFLHRESRNDTDKSYEQPVGEPTEEEIDDFLFSNPWLDAETVSHLTDPGLLGFHSNSGQATEGWIAEFREKITSWANTTEWKSADIVNYHIISQFEAPESEVQIWTPPDLLNPSFFSFAPNHLLLAEKLLKEGRLLSEMGWREFEKLIGDLLEMEGWKVTVMQGSKDGGIDILSERQDKYLGTLRAIWQAKKYGEGKKVTLSHLRELSAVVEKDRATKGIIVTTSSLTRGAIEWVQSDRYKLEAKDGRFVEHWVRSRLFEPRMIADENIQFGNFSSF